MNLKELKLMDANMFGHKYANYITEFNSIKRLLIDRGNRFTKDEFLGLLGTMSEKLKWNSIFPYMQPHIVYKVWHGNRRKSEAALYSFKYTDRTGCDAHYNTLLNYFKKIDSNKHKPRKVVDNVPNNISDAIALLKAHGYKIMKPTTSYEEI